MVFKALVKPTVTRLYIFLCNLCHLSDLQHLWFPFMKSWHLWPAANIWSEFWSICRQKWNQFQTTNHQDIYQFYNLINTVFIQLLLLHDVENPPFRTASEKKSPKKTPRKRNFPTLKSQGGSSKTGWSGYFLGQKRCQASRWDHKRPQQKGLINGVK